ncbi:hypothetical protein LTS17_009982 [Exophiala oligosperma]
MATSTSPQQPPTLRLVHKTHYDRQYFFTPSLEKLGPLGESSVRVQTSLITLASNNLSYCALGTVAHWWDIYPTPSWLDSPYDDSSEYGVGVCWGYATVLESKVPQLQPGTLLWGMWPISTFPVDLLLNQSSDVPACFVEISSHRSQAMTLYNEYFTTTESLGDPKGLEMLAWRSVLIVWAASYVYNRFNFASDPKDPIINPAGDGLPWSREDADLSSAVVICMGAGSKTSRGFVHQLATNRAPGSGPLAVVEVSSSTPLSTLSSKISPPFAHRETTYADLDTPSVQKFIFDDDNPNVKRIVVMIMAGRQEVVEPFVLGLRNNHATHRRQITVTAINVGAEARVLSPQEIAERGAVSRRINALFCNTSPIRDEAMKILGPKTLVDQQDAELNRVISEETKSREDGKVFGVSLKVYKGLRGEQGAEGAWERLVRGKVLGDEGLAFLL